MTTELELIIALLIGIIIGSAIGVWMHKHPRR
jgi:hypothetical protein